MEHELPPLASHACKVQRLPSSRPEWEPEIYQRPLMPGRFVPIVCRRRLLEMPGLAHTHTHGGRGCSAHSTYLTRNRACQQVKILTPTLSLLPGAILLFLSGSAGYLRSKVHLFMGDIPRTRIPAQAMATSVSWAVAILLGRQTKDPAAATVCSP